MYAETKQPKLEISCFDIKNVYKVYKDKLCYKMPKDILKNIKYICVF